MSMRRHQRHLIIAVHHHTILHILHALVYCLSNYVLTIPLPVAKITIHLYMCSVLVGGRCNSTAIADDVCQLMDQRRMMYDKKYLHAKFKGYLVI